MDGDIRIPLPVSDRVNELEKKVREMEALIKGLTNELLDLKSIVERLNSRMEEKRPPVMARPAGRVTISQKGQEGAPATEGEVARIMQPDGTLKEERRKDSDYIIASARSAAALKKGKGEQSKGKGSSALIYAVEEEETQSKK